MADVRRREGDGIVAVATCPKDPVEGSNVAAKTLAGADEEPRVDQTATVVAPGAVKASPSIPAVPFGTVKVCSMDRVEPLIEKIVPAPSLVSVAQRLRGAGKPPPATRGRWRRPGQVTAATWPESLSLEIRFLAVRLVVSRDQPAARRRGEGR